MRFGGKPSARDTTSNSTLAAEFILEADMHCHLLPSWDDGPRNLEGSLEMARRAAQCGVRRIVVTPHVGKAFGATEKPAEEIPGATVALQKEITAAGIDLEVVPGAEIMLSVDDLPTRLKNESWLTVGGKNRYVLLEAPTNVWSEIAENLLFAISLGGFTPIVAHPERYADVQRDISIMERAVELGAVVQITARSLVGANRPSKECGTRLMRAGLVSLVASDAHKAQHLWPTEVAMEMCELIGDEATHQILKDNPLAVLNGKTVTPIEVKQPKPKKFWLW